MRYKILGTNCIKMFVNIMMQLKITHNDAIASGVSEEEINKVNKIAVDKDIIILALPDDLLLGENINRIFQFVPINKESRSSSGVFVPVKVGDNIEDYGNFLEAPLPMLSEIDTISDLSKIMYKNVDEAEIGSELHKILQRAGAGGRKQKGKSVKQEGRPHRKKAINKDDIDEINKLLKAGNDKEIDVSDFLKLI